MIPFCRVIRPTKSTNGMSGSILYSREHGAGSGVGPVLVQVDAVVDHADLLGRDAIERLDVARMDCETAITPSAFW